MRTLPRTVTWLIDPSRPNGRALCLEASAPERVAKFLRRVPGAQWLSTAWGCDAHGRPLDAAARRRLRNGIYRARKRQPAPASSGWIEARPEPLLQHVAELWGISLADLIDSRQHRHAKARGYAAHRLKQVYNLPQSHIAEILGYHDHSCVAYWLAYPFDKLQPPMQPEGFHGHPYQRHPEVSQRR